MKISLYLTEAEWVAAKKAANENGLSVSFVIRVALRSHLDMPNPGLSQVVQHDPLYPLRDRLERRTI